MCFLSTNFFSLPNVNNSRMKSISVSDKPPLKYYCSLWPYHSEHARSHLKYYCRQKCFAMRHSKTIQFSYAIILGQNVYSYFSLQFCSLFQITACFRLDMCNSLGTLHLLGVPALYVIATSKYDEWIDECHLNSIHL